MVLGIVAGLAGVAVVALVLVYVVWRPRAIRRALTGKWGGEVGYLRMSWQHRMKTGEVVPGADLYVVFSESARKGIYAKTPGAHVSDIDGMEPDVFLLALNGETEVSVGTRVLQVVALKVVDGEDPFGAPCHLEVCLPALDDYQAIRFGLYYPPEYVQMMAEMNASFVRGWPSI